MRSLISLIAVLASGSVAELLTPDAPPMRGASFAPQIACQISMQSWCITNAVEVVSMSYEDGVRTWILNDKLYFNDGPLVVVENKANCSSGSGILVKRIYDKPSGDKYILSYSLTGERGCSLEFRIPMKNGSFDQSYKQVILYQIMINGRQIYNYEKGFAVPGAKIPE